MELVQKFDVHPNQITAWRGPLHEGGYSCDLSLGPADILFRTAKSCQHQLPRRHLGRSMLVSGSIQVKAKSYAHCHMITYVEFMHKMT